MVWPAGRSKNAPEAGSTGASSKITFQRVPSDALRKMPYGDLKKHVRLGLNVLRDMRQDVKAGELPESALVPVRRQVELALSERARRHVVVNAFQGDAANERFRIRYHEEAMKNPLSTPSDIQYDKNRMEHAQSRMKRFQNLAERYRSGKGGLRSRQLGIARVRVRSEAIIRGAQKRTDEAKARKG